ncbi:intracellular growth locus C protein, partial [Francisella tularensis]|nr:intracellular growth locus C protein [Francisella tularensis]
MIILFVVPGSINPTISITLGVLIKSKASAKIIKIVSIILHASATDIK